MSTSTQCASETQSAYAFQSVALSEGEEYSIIHSRSIPRRVVAQKAPVLGTNDDYFFNEERTPTQELASPSLEPIEQSISLTTERSYFVSRDEINPIASFSAKNQQSVLNTVESVKEAIRESIYMVKYPLILPRVTKGSTKSTRLVVQLTKFMTALNAFFLFSQIHHENEVSAFANALTIFHQQLGQSEDFIREEIQILDSKSQNLILQAIREELEKISPTENATFLASYLLKEMFSERFTIFPVFDSSRTHFSLAQIIEQLESIHSLFAFAEEVIQLKAKDDSRSLAFDELCSVSPLGFKAVFSFLEGSIQRQTTKLMNRLNDFYSRYNEYLSKLPEVKFSVQENDYCEICNAAKTKNKRLRCGHQFHQRCIFYRLTNANNLECPVCSQIISPSFLAEEQLNRWEIGKFEQLLKKFLVNAFLVRSLTCSSDAKESDFLKLGQFLNSDLTELLNRLTKYIELQKEDMKLEFESKSAEFILQKAHFISENYMRDDTFYTGMWHLRSFFNFQHLFNGKDWNQNPAHSIAEVEEEMRKFFELDIEVKNEK